MHPIEVSAYSVGSFIGSLISVYLLTRLLFFIQRKLIPDLASMQARVIVYGLYMIIATIIRGLNLDHNDGPQFATAFIEYLPAVAILFFYDSYRNKSLGRTAESQILDTSVPNTSGNTEKQFCGQCGAKREGDGKFCSSCGAAI
jgi:hypothetical protein